MRKHRSNDVGVHIGLRLIGPNGGSVPVAATLHYAGNDPFAVHVVFHARQAALHSTVESYARTGSEYATEPKRVESAPGSGDVSWSFSRDLLADGLSEPTGYGDVRIWPWANGGRGTVALALSSPDGYALFEAPRAVVEGFLARSYACVPAGAEESFLDIDSSVANLLAERDVDPR